MEVNIKHRPYRKERYGWCLKSGTKTVTYRKYKPRKLYPQRKRFKADV